MKGLRFLIVGILFGIVMTKSEAISWYRIQEMFRFQSFHMYGIIGVAVVGGALMFYLMKKFSVKTIEGENPTWVDKPKTHKASLFGGILFGLGWAMTGACPGPLYVLVGNGHLVILIVILSALVGTMAYGMLKSKLPH
ncbi:MAG: YeeE/YedE family protein [Saprospiraceae bacterium]|nr:YeeE/YedE family protein [Saprospiraceae bacterium]